MFQIVTSCLYALSYNINDVENKVLKKKKKN